MTFQLKTNERKVVIALAAIIATTLILAWAFQAWTFLDLETSRIFWANADFVGNQPLVDLARDGFRVIFVCALGAAGWGVLAAYRRQWLGLERRAWFAILLCLTIGPGLVANIVFKQYWGRPRPHQTVEFGGTKQFQAAWQPSSECKRHCSFVSGEAAATFSVFYAFALVLPTLRNALVGFGTLAGLLAGFVRISQGGHFLSDVVFAGTLMLAVSIAVYAIVMFRAPRVRRSAVST